MNFWKITEKTIFFPFRSPTSSETVPEGNRRYKADNIQQHSFLCSRRESIGLPICMDTTTFVNTAQRVNNSVSKVPEKLGVILPSELKPSSSIRNWWCRKEKCMPDKVFARESGQRISRSCSHQQWRWEAQNKLLKYTYLPRKENITLSELLTVVIDTYLPESYQKYLFKNYQMSETCRSYGSFVPEFLRGHPKSVIIHCL